MNYNVQWKLYLTVAINTNTEFFIQTLVSGQNHWDIHKLKNIDYFLLRHLSREMLFSLPDICKTLLTRIVLLHSLSALKPYHSAKLQHKTEPGNRMQKKPILIQAVISLTARNMLSRFRQRTLHKAPSQVKKNINLQQCSI